MDTDTDLICYPTYPIESFGQRENFLCLNDAEWISFQCILFWDHCFKEGKKSINPTMTFFFFLKTFSNVKQIFGMEQMNYLWQLYQKRRISATFYLEKNIENYCSLYIKIIELCNFKKKNFRIKKYCIFNVNLQLTK